MRTESAHTTGPAAIPPTFAGEDADPAALLIVDVQKDFCAGGALAVPQGDSILPAVNRYLEAATRAGLVVYASRDWHPSDSRHFTQRGGIWPPHCVQGSSGAEFHPEVKLPASSVIISKGIDPGADGYSAFDGQAPDGRRFLDDLRQRGVGHLYVGGLATDYCVKYTVLDALAAGLMVTVLADAIAGVSPVGSAVALEQMEKRGATVRTNVAFLDRIARPE